MCIYKLCFKGYLSLLVMLFLSLVPVGAMEIEDKTSLDIWRDYGKLADTDGDGLLEIHNPDSLQLINLDLAAGYELLGDIELSDSDNWQPIGTSDSPFTGVLDGNSHRVTFSNISIGLFGYLRDAQISNIRIEADGFVSEGSSGILAGSSYNSDIANIHLKVNSPTRTTVVTELLVGYMEGGIIWESSNSIESTDLDNSQIQSLGSDNKINGQEHQ